MSRATPRKTCLLLIALLGAAFLPRDSFVSPPAPGIGRAAASAEARAREAYGRLPMSFEANQGQTDSQVRFLSRGGGYVLFLTPEEAVLSLRRRKSMVSDPADPNRRSVGSFFVNPVLAAGEWGDLRDRVERVIPGLADFQFAVGPGSVAGSGVDHVVGNVDYGKGASRSCDDFQ